MRRGVFAVLVVAIVSSATVAGAVLSTGELTPEEERAFFSDDHDKSVEQVSNPNATESFVKVTDIPYFTTKPKFEISNTTLFEYQQRSVSEMETGQSSSFALGRSQMLDSGMIDPAIKDAHVTFLAIHGGAKSLAGPLSADFEDTFLIGSSGTVISHMDYRIRGNLPPANDCGPKTKATKKVDYDDDGNYQVVLTDGTQTCYQYSMNIEETRELSIGEESFSGGDEIHFSGLTSNSIDELQLSGLIELQVNETEITRDWDPDPDVEYPDEWSDGEWSKSDVQKGVYLTESVNPKSESYDVLVTDTGELDVEQQIVNVSTDLKYIVLSFEGPRGSDTVSISDIKDRLLWSHLIIGSDEAFVDSTWRTYSTRQYLNAVNYTKDGWSPVRDPPHVPQLFLIGTDRRPTINSVNQSGDVSAKVVGYEGYNVSMNQINHSEVTIDPSTPIEYSSIVIRDAPGNVTSLKTIHGTEIDVDVDEVLEYRQPNISISSLPNSNNVQVHVEDPITNAPLSGREVKLYGLDPQSTKSNGVAVTNSSGSVVGQRTNTLVRVRVLRDDWDNPTGSIFYGEAVASRTFLPNLLMLERLRALLGTLLLVAPLIFLYGYIRHFGLFE